MPIHSGSVNLSTGNAQIVLPLCGWGGRGGGLRFSLVFNSQSARSSAVGPGWTHSYRWLIASYSPDGPNAAHASGVAQTTITPSALATVITDDGTELTFTGSGSTLNSPGFYDTLTLNANGTATLRRKGGAVYQFNSGGLLTSITDISGNVTTITYNSNNLMATITDAANRRIVLGYTNGVLSNVTDCAGRVCNLGWNAAYDTQFIYDPLLNGVQYSRKIGYDANNNVNALTDRLGKLWQYTYSGTTFVSATDPDSHAWSLAYAALDAGIAWPATASIQANWTNSNGKVTKFALDASGRPVGVNDATNRLTTFAWDGSNNRTDQWTPSGAHTQWGYDSRGNVTLLTDPFGKQTIQTYDYSNGDKRKYVKDPLGHETFYNYPTSTPYNGNLNSVKDARGFTTAYLYNADGTVKQKTDAEGRVTKYAYDTWGHLNTVTVVKDANTSFVTTTTFTKDSLLSQRTDARSRVTNYTYDAWGRLKQKDYPTSGRTSVVLTLDANGRITQATDATGMRTYNVFDA